MTKKLGIIQSRGLGDIVIALPIARHYYDLGWHIHWPIAEEFLPHVINHVPWITWHPVKTDHGPFFLEKPMKLLTQIGCDEILPLYQALTGQDFHLEPWFQYTSFDQYKYIRAAVPFYKKWQLEDCITRDMAAEQALKNKLVKKPQYAVLHLEGSDHRAQFDRRSIPPEWQTIEITPQHTSSIFNWISLLESAESIVCVDSCIANMVDQLNIDNDLYFIPRSHIGLTPVLAQHWHWIKP
jgi:hypothetical protein